MIDTNLLYTNSDSKNWFYERYYYGGGNSRYYTFQLALNLLNQKTVVPLIVETGCQRQEEDVGAGMSTSIFVEYIDKYGGKVITCDNCEEHIDRAIQYCKKWPKADVSFVVDDSLHFLKSLEIPPNLLYLDSLDYPVGDDEGNLAMQVAAQTHCLNEFLSVENILNSGCLLLIDDNQLPGGGKPAKLKEYLLENKQWTLLLDLQSSLWIKQ